MEVQISQFVPIVSSKLLAYHVIKDERLVSKVEGKTNFFDSRRLQAVRNRDCCLEIIDVRCNLKQFDGLT